MLKSAKIAKKKTQENHANRHENLFLVSYLSYEGCSRLKISKNLTALLFLIKPDLRVTLFTIYLLALVGQTENCRKILCINDICKYLPNLVQNGQINFLHVTYRTAQKCTKVEFSVQDFFSKCD